jgi:succinoglycan biosynthesis protein ExoW
MIAVIIPFFQSTKGLLCRALQSVLDQDTDRPWHVFVVDDGSPVSAVEEAAPLGGALAGRWTLIRQHNKGVSAARNRALDSLDGTYEIVAFLDSDDVWEQGHLERINASIDAGADFYFDDYRRYDCPHSRFTDSVLATRQFDEFDPVRELCWLEAKFFDLLLSGSPAGTSSIAYRWDKLPHVRFRTDLWYCEDVYFWMQASRFTRKIAFSPAVGAFCGKGVNISEGPWGTSKLVKRVAGQTRYQHLVQAEFPLTAAQKQWNMSLLRSLDVDFWQSALAASVRGDYRCAPLLLSYLAMRPGAVSRIPAALARAMQGKFFRRRLDAQ